MKKIVFSIRARIVLGLIAIIIVMNLVLGFLTSLYVNRIFIEEAQSRVNYDLNSAVDIYNDYVDRVQRTLRLITIHRNESKTLYEDITADLEAAYTNKYIQSRLDILTFVDTLGNVIYRAHNPEIKGDNMSGNLVIKKVLKEWAPEKGNIIMDENDLLNEGGKLSKNAIVKVISTPNSINTNKTIEKRGMFIAYALPIFSQKGDKKLGVLFGACLLNNTTEIVDKIKEIVFQDQVYKGKDIGTVTIFFDDVRISTNVKQSDNTRAVGSRLSKEVYDYVIKNGKVWGDRAFVVNNWYITAYKPIMDPEGRIIGAIYTGLMEEPFKIPQKIIMLFFIIALCVTAIASLVLIFFYTRVVMRPIENVLVTIQKIKNGDLSARCKIQQPGEMGLLSKTINQMARSLEQSVNKLQEDTKIQLMQSEKLASVGRLAAGVAHEINNPLTGVLTFAHFLKEKKTNDKSDLHDIDVIIQETTRVRDIIRGLLDFARQTPSNKAMINVNETIQLLLNLIKGQKEFRNILIVENYSENLPELCADKNQLQQVFLNLILNAGEAISGSGTITISTSLVDNNIRITIADTGCGISSEDIDKIFDPFFTTKPVGKGTGLGLSVSYGIIQQHGGSISCESKQYEGTVFKILFPLSNNKLS